MCRYVAAGLCVIILQLVAAAPPLRLTIDCPLEENDNSDLRSGSKSARKSDVDSVCNLINKAIPKAVEDGHFFLVEEKSSDLSALGDTLRSIAVPPPKGFIPKFPKLTHTRLSIPRINVPTLVGHKGQMPAPRVGARMSIARLRDAINEESSAERMERFKKVVKTMLHVVKVMGKVDEYVSDRTRIIVEKLSKSLE